LKKCIILANGKPPQKSVVRFLMKKDFNTLICADGGSNSAKKLNLIPDFIIGDLDSSKESTLQYFNKKSKIIRITRQNDTDVEKCLKFVIKNKVGEAVLLGVTGDRLDHTFCNLGIVIKFFDKIKLNIIAENSFLTAYKSTAQLKTLPGETISIYGFDSTTRIISKGLKFPLKNIALPFGQRESTSNVALSNNVNLRITGGVIFVIRDYNVMKKNDLF
jgi:thiamine pyrophosphokinase